MWGFFFEQKQTERAAGNRSPNCLFGLPHSGRIWLHETLGPHFPACPAVRLSALLSLPLPLSDLRLLERLQMFGEGTGRSLARCWNWLGA